jgi:hypothetical protein
MFEQENIQAAVPQSAGRWAAIAIVVVAVFAGAFGLTMHERTLARQAAIERDQVTAQLQETQGQISALTDKLNTLAAAEQANHQAMEAAAKRASEQRVTSSRSTAARRRAALENEKRWKDVQSKLDAQNQKLDAQGQAISKTQQDLDSAKNELSSSIARNHGELVLLQRKGERNYYEFDLTKSKQFQRSGPVGIALRKADTKHAYADLELMIEDAKLQQKHVNLYQPVLFYPPDSATPMELVINQVTKNHIHGYVSAPKYRQSELKASADTENQNADASRKRLPQPQ